MQVRYRCRLSPHPHQQAAPARAFGCARVVWNDALALGQGFYRRGEKYPGGGELQKLCFTRNAFWVEGETLRLTKVGSIPTTWSRDLPATPSSVTLIKDCAGRYFASFVVEVERPQLEPNGKTVGIDLGLASLALSAGLAARLNACGAETQSSLLVSGSEAGTHLNQGVRPCTP